MSVIHEDLIAVLDAVSIESPFRYYLLEEKREIADVGPTGGPPEPELTRLVEALAVDLYERLYIRPSWKSLTINNIIARRDLVAALSAANCGRGTWEAGWTIRHLEEDGQVAIARGEITFWAKTESLRVGDQVIQAGSNCRVWIPKELRGLIPGFYLALGDGGDEDDDHGDDSGPAGRYYWHLMPGMAVHFMQITTSLLNHSRIPFQVKVLDDPSAYRRADAGVIYLRRRDQPRIGPIIARIHSQVAHGLRGEVPLFTKRLSDGLGFAEDPVGSQSFGEHRCRLIAEALCHSNAHGVIERDARIAALASAFLEKGFDPLRPHLGSGSGNEFDPPPLSVSPVGHEKNSMRLVRDSSSTGEPTPLASMTLFEAAIQIGRSLCLSALWDSGDRICNWIGRSNAEAERPGGPITPTAAARGPDLYGGSAGIALFLAQLYALTGVDEFRRTALGAITRSIRQLDFMQAQKPIPPLSLFFGDLGIAWATRKIAALTKSSELLGEVDPILHKVFEARTAPHEFDLIGGTAGAIIALLDVGLEPGLERCRDLAIDLAEELCQVAPSQLGTRRANGHGSSGSELQPYLPSGLSHGAAGIGLALFEIHATTGRLDFREFARRVFDYEDTLFHRQHGNWAYANPSGRPPFDDTSPSFSSAWCHGGPGIALSRLRAASLDPEFKEDYLNLARVAITSTLKALEEKLLDQTADATPCHGLSGLIEIIWIAGPILNIPSYRARPGSSSSLGQPPLAIGRLAFGCPIGRAESIADDR